MKKILFSALLLIVACKSQKPIADSNKTIELPTVEVKDRSINDYRASVTKTFDLVHTKLDVSFDWEIGRAHV